MKNININEMYNNIEDKRKTDELELKTKMMWLAYKVWCNGRGLEPCDLKNYVNYIKNYKNI